MAFSLTSSLASVVAMALILDLDLVLFLILIDVCPGEASGSRSVSPFIAAAKGEEPPLAVPYAFSAWEW